MARNVTLSKLLNDVRAKARLSLSTSANNQVRDRQVIVIQQVQQWLYDEHDWPHLRVERFIDLQEGQRFYDPADTMDSEGNAKSDLIIDNVDSIQVRYGDTWIPLAPSIGATQYNEFSSELDQRSWPVQNWKVYEGEQIEVWPVPDQNATIGTGSLEGRLKIIGIRNLNDLVEDDDRCDLDSDIIVNLAAAQLTDDKALAQLYNDYATRRLNRLVGKLVKADSYKLFGIGRPDNRRRPRRMAAVYIAPSGS